MSRFTLTPDLLDLIVERFKALAEPARLRTLNALTEGEKSVSDLIRRPDSGRQTSPNISNFSTLSASSSGARKGCTLTTG